MWQFCQLCWLLRHGSAAVEPRDIVDPFTSPIYKSLVKSAPGLLPNPMLSRGVAVGPKEMRVR
jgi:hypothetical protein